MADTIYDWNGKNLPEELCFYQNGKKRFSCICHKSCLFIEGRQKKMWLFQKKKKLNIGINK